MSAVRGLWLALLVLVAACASTAQAGTQDGGNERCGCDMASGAVRWVEVDLATFDPNTTPGIHPGDIITPIGGGSFVGMVYRQNATTLNAVTVASISVVNTVWTPGASGQGTLAVTVTDGLGEPVPDALVDVDVVMGGNITSMGIAAGVGVLNSRVGTGTSSMIFHGQTAPAGVTAGRIDVAVVGVPGATFRFITALRYPGTGLVSMPVPSERTGTLPP